VFRWLLYIVAAAALIAAAVWLADNAGTVTLHWRGWRIDTSVAALIVAGAAALVAAGILHRLWLAVARAPGDWRESWRRRRRERGYEALTRGMVAIAAGDADEARRQSRRAEGLLDEPPLTLLLAAQAAQLSGDEQAAGRFFATMSERPETEFLGVRGLLGQAIKRGDRAGALEFARRAWRLRPDSGWAAEVMFDLEAKEGRWRDARASLAEAARRGALDRGVARRREAALLVEIAREAMADGRPDEARDLAGEAHKLRPDLVAAAAEYARALLAGEKFRKAGAAIEKTYALAPHAGLADLYARARRSPDALAAAREIRQLTEGQPTHPESLFALARAYAAAKLWGEARHAIDQFGHRPPARACRLMAEIEESEHGDMNASRRWLMRANVAEPDPAWVCDSCGAAADDWRAACAKCGAFDTLEWRAPARVAALAAPEASTAPRLAAGDSASESGSASVPSS
jgi:HemY protein